MTRTYKYASLQKKKNAKNAWSMFILILAYILLSIYRQDMAPATKMISPLPDKAHAAEPTPIPNTWDRNLITIVKEFKDLGKEKTLKAIRIAYCESGLEEKAFNPMNADGSNDGGVFQWNSIHGLPDEVRFDAEKNIKLAKAKVQAEGDFYAWACND